jgi:hypothetical protein
MIKALATMLFRFLWREDRSPKARSEDGESYALER